MAEFANYTSTVSDHLPVIARFTLMPVAAESGPEAGVAVTVVPNPTAGSASVRFSLEAPADVRITVVDALGRRVLEHAGAFGVGEHAVPVGSERLASGVYGVRVETDRGVVSRTFVRSR